MQYPTDRSNRVTYADFRAYQRELDRRRRVATMERRRADRVEAIRRSSRDGGPRPGDPAYKPRVPRPAVPGKETPGEYVERIKPKVIPTKQASQLARALRRASRMAPHPAIRIASNLWDLYDLASQIDALARSRVQRGRVYVKPGPVDPIEGPEGYIWPEGWVHSTAEFPPDPLPADTPAWSFAPLTAAIYQMTTIGGIPPVTISDSSGMLDGFPATLPQPFEIGNYFLSPDFESLLDPAAIAYRSSDATGWARTFIGLGVVDRVDWSNRQFWDWSSPSPVVQPTRIRARTPFHLPPVPVFYPAWRYGDPFTEPSNADPWRQSDSSNPSVDFPSVAMPVIALPEPLAQPVTLQPATQDIIVGEKEIERRQRRGRPRNRRFRKPRVKERKLRLGPIASAVWVIIGEITEPIELVEALHDAMPRVLRAKGVRPNPIEKARALYDGWDDPRFSVAKAFEAYLNNQFEDWFYGIISVDKAANQLTNSPTGKGRFATDSMSNAYETTGEGLPLPTFNFDPATGSWSIDFLERSIQVYRGDRF